MIKKKVFYVSVNESDRPSTLEIVDIYNKDEFLLTIAHEFKTIREHIKIISRRDNILSVFSVLDYLVSQDREYSLDTFRICLEYIQQKIQNIPIQELFFLWLTQFPESQIETDVKVSQDIISSYNLNIGDVVDEFRDWKEQLEQRRQLVDEEFEALQVRVEALFTDQCPPQDIVPFTIRKIRIAVQLPYTHSLYHFFDTANLSRQWILALYKDMVRTSSMERIAQDRFEDILIDRNVDQLMIYHEDLEQFITLEYSETNPLMLALTLDIRPFEDLDVIRREVQSILGVETTDIYQTRSVSGILYLKQQTFEKLVWHDYLMNDPIAQHYLYINELERATRFGENVTIHFEKSITAILINSKNDMASKPLSLAYFRGNYVKVNILRASGSQNDLESVTRFQNILCAVLTRFQSAYDDYQALYTKTLPATVFAPLRPSTDEEEGITTNFADKYKNVFKKTGYKTSCRPKSRVPTIVTEQEAIATNPLRVMKFPKDGDETLGIPQEYIVCQDPEYAFPGITSLAGGSLFVPCCFNKNPRSSKAFLEYYKGEKVAEPRGTEHIKSEHQIIKTFGDVGKLPSGIHQFLVALMPTQTFYRIGTEDTPNTILHSLNYLKGGAKKTDHALRQEIIEFFGQNLNVCKQENYAYTHAQILDALKNEDMYFDPRKFYRLLEVYFDVNIVLFTKSKKTEELQLLSPDYKNFHIRFECRKDQPFVFLYEHWGTSPDRYTKRLHPVCEMIMSDGKRTYTLDDNSLGYMNQVYQSVFTLFPIQQNCPPLLPELRYKSQIIDSWGKCRGFICEMRENRYVYLESMLPLPPIYIAGEDDNISITTIYIPSLEMLKTAFQGMEVLKMVRYLETTYIHFKYMSYEWKTQVRSSLSDELFEKVASPFLSYSPSSRRDERVPTISKQKQLARIVLDYTLFLYSKYAMDSFDFDAFFNRHCVIRQDHKYPSTVYEELPKNPGIMDNERLILTSMDVRNKLEFNIQYHLLYKYEELKKYKNLHLLPNFWDCPYDFMNWKETYYITVFERLMMKSSYLQIDNVPINELSKEKGYWYFREERPFENWRFPFRYVQVDSQNEAIAITAFWRKNGQIPHFQVDIPADISIVTVSVMDHESHEWVPSIDEVEEEEDTFRVFMGSNKKGQTYVFLEIKN